MPAVAAAEVALLHGLRHIDLGMPELKAALADVASIRFLELDFAQVETFATLHAIRDPFDRLIVSAALATGSSLISRDATLAESEIVRVIW